MPAALRGRPRRHGRAGLSDAAGLAGGGKGFHWNVGNWSGSSDSDVFSSGSGSARGGDWSELASWGRWLLEHPFWVAAAVFGCLVLIAIIVVVLWLSSRGKFMFLDNVVHDRAEVVRPWKRFRRLGDSLFGFQIAFIASMMLVMLLAALVGLAIVELGNEALGGLAAWIGLVFGISIALPLILAVGFAQYFLDAFVVPLMHRYDLGVLAAWGRFGAIFRQHPWVLLISGLFVLIVGFAAVMAALIAGVLTCCIGLILIIIPYVGTVVLLPIPVTYRGFTVALLDQIDPGYFSESGSVAPAQPTNS